MPDKIVEKPRVSNNSVPLGYAIFSIVVVVLAQYIISGWVNNYGTSADVVSHVSFAGTLVSIALAFLAIVYSYYQNFAQQRDAASIASQVELLRGVVLEGRSSQTQFAGELIKFEEISAKLDESIGVVNRSREESRQWQQQMISAIEKKGQEEEPVPENWSVDLAAEVVVSRAATLQLAIYVALVRGAAEGLGIQRVRDTYLIAALNDGAKHMDAYVKGAFALAWYTLLDVDIMETRASDGYELADEFVRRVNARREDFLATANNREQYFDVHAVAGSSSEPA